MERGTCWLSRGADGSPPHKAKTAQPKRVRAARDELELLRVLLGAGLQQALANAREIAAGQETPGHVHQLRVGLRRLRTALRAFGESAPALAACEPAIAKVFRALGTWQRLRYLAEFVAPRYKRRAPCIVF